MRKRLSLALLLGFATQAALGQAVSTASRRADLQVGVGFGSMTSDYDVNRWKGFAFYTVVDLTNHLGGEFVIHQGKASDGSGLYERTFEIGPRYVRHYGRFSPYIKAMIGRGVFNFAIGGTTYANLAYNMFAGGIGVDARVLKYLNVRIDYEYQDWLSFPPTGLTPQLITFGVAYHYPGDLGRGRHY